MDIEAITTAAAWDALEPEWDELVERSGRASVFLTWEWLRPWWRHCRPADASLYVLAAREDGRLVGLAPLYRSRLSACGLGSLRRVGFIGDASGDSEYLDVVAESGREADVVGACFDHLDADPAGWDVAAFRLVPKDSPSFDALRQVAAARGLLFESRDVACSAVELPDDWDAYLATLQSRFRGKLRSLLRRLPAEHGAEFVQCTDADDLPERLASMYELHQQRWHAEGKPGSFASAARRNFYAEMAEGFLRRGWLRLYSLRLDARWAAHEFSFEHRGRVYYLQQGFDTSCGKLSVGIALKAHVLSESIAGGARVYDFLGGIAPHKEKLGAQPRWCAHVTVARPCLRTRWRLWLPRFAERVRDRARALTPQRLLRAKRDVQERRRQKRAERLSAEHEND